MGWKLNGAFRVLTAAALPELLAAAAAWVDQRFAALPLEFLEVWGRVGFLLGILLSVAAYGGFTFRPGGRWGIGREREAWDDKALVALAVTFGAVVLSGAAGASVVLVPGAQTFESSKDLVVFLCVVLFGRPALLVTPVAYALADLIEGVRPSSIADWFVGYWMNPAFFWVAHQLIGKDPDFRRAKTWSGYLVFVVVFMTLEPASWGFLCSSTFSAAVAYRSVTPALFFTTAVTWLVAPVVTLVAYPIVRALGLFWADRAEQRDDRPAGLPIRWMIVLPLGALLLAVGGTTAFLTLRQGERDATAVGVRFQEEVVGHLDLRLDALVEVTPAWALAAELDALLALLPLTEVQGRAFVVDRSGARVAGERADAVLVAATTALGDLHGGLANVRASAPFTFEIVTLEPLARERWLGQAAPYVDRRGGHADWLLVTAMPESAYLQGVRSGSSHSAMALALFLVLSLFAAALLAGLVTEPLCRLVETTRAVAAGDLGARAPASRLEEVRALSEAFDEMTVALSDADRQLRTARDAAESADRAKSAFLDVAAHELRTPLTPMTLLLQLVRRNLAQGLPVEARHVDAIADGLRRLTGLVDDLLDLPRLERGLLTLRRAAVDVVPAVRRSIEEFRLIAPDRSITYEGPPGPVVAVLDPDRFHQVMANLLDNALTHTPADTPVEVEVHDRDRSVRVRVVDHGAGIPPDARPLVFTRFHRSTAEPATGHQGLGLGLYISRAIVDLHGGSIGVEDTSGRGATVWFELPKQGAAGG